MPERLSLEGHIRPVSDTSTDSSTAGPWSGRMAGHAFGATAEASDVRSTVHTYTAMIDQVIGLAGSTFVRRSRTSWGLVWGTTHSLFAWKAPARLQGLPCLHVPRGWRRDGLNTHNAALPPTRDIQLHRHPSVLGPYRSCAERCPTSHGMPAPNVTQSYQELLELPYQTIEAC